MANAQIARAYDIRLVRALADHLDANPDADVNDSLGALVLHLQGDEPALDSADRELVRALSRAVLDSFAPPVAAE